MKKLRYLGLMLSSLFAATTACSDNRGGTETSTAPTATTSSDSTTTPAGNPGPGVAAETYTCTMHPEVIAHAPGKCPKCGMDLIEK